MLQGVLAELPGSARVGVDEGMAVDIAFREEDGAVDIQEIFICALQAGYTGIGIYWNGIAWSFHFDLRPIYAFWTAVKGHREIAWIYRPLLSQNPDNLFVL